MYFIIFYLKFEQKKQVGIIIFQLKFQLD